MHLVVSDNGDKPLRIRQTQGVVCMRLPHVPLLSAGGSDSLEQILSADAVPLNVLIPYSIAQSPKLVNCFFAQNAPGNFDSPNLPKGIHSPKSQNVVLHQL